MRLSSFVTAPFAALLLSVTLLPAATRTWLNTAGGNWNVAGNWSGGVVTDADDDVFVSANGTYTVTVDSTAQFASLTLGGGTGTQTLRWEGGSLDAEISILSSGELLFALNSANAYLSGGTVNNQGRFVWTPAATQNLRLIDAVLVNASGGLCDIQNDGFIGRFAGSAEFVNHGTVRKSAGSGFTDFSSGVAVTNTGTFQVQSGTVRFSSGFVSSGPMDVSTGANIDLYNGTFTLLSGHTFTGAGTYGVIGGGGPVIDGPIINDNFILSLGTLTITNELQGTLQWRGGTLRGDLGIAPSGILNFELNQANQYLSNGSITNRGRFIWRPVASQHLRLIDAHFVNSSGGLCDFQRDGFVQRFAGDASFINHGTVRKSAGEGFTDFNSGVALTNTGTFQVQTGTVRFSDGFVSSGPMDVSAGASIDLYNGTFTLLSGHTFTGAGTYGVIGGGGPVIDGPIINDNFILSLGSLTITNQLQGTLQWRGGTLRGDLQITPSGVLNFELAQANQYVSSGSITNHGLFVWRPVASQHLRLIDTVFVNASDGLCDIQNDGSIQRFAGYASFINHGTVRKSAGAGFTDFNTGVVLTNTGSFQVQSGTVRFSDGFVSSGPMDVSDGASIDLYNGTFTLLSGHTFTGAGTYGVIGGGGPVIDGPIINDNFILSLGTLTITNELQGTLQWRGGTLGGDLRIAPSGTLNFELNQANQYLRNGSITNQGRFIWRSVASQHLRLIDAHFVNSSGGLCDFQRDGFIQRFAGYANFINHGTVRKSAGIGFTDFNAGVAVTNTGAIEALSGTLHFGGDFAQLGGSVKFGISGDSEFGKISVFGNAPLNGGVAAMLMDGYVPPVNHTFEVMTFGSRNGTFGDTSGLTVGSGRAFEPLYTATTLTLRAFEVDDVVISGHPQSLTVIAGNPAEFTVAATGTGQLTYQWRHNNNPLPNSNTNRLVIPNVQPGNAGAYDVIVTSGAGNATSQAATLTVHVPPHIAAPPLSRTVATGETATFSVGATGVPAPTYQWYFNGSAIPGANGASFDVPAAMTGNVGSYSVVASNAAGSVTNTVHLALVDLRMFAGVIIDAEIGARFRVEFTTDVNTPTTNWIDLGAVTLTNRPHFFFDLDSPGQPHRFYRAVPLPAP